jgi:hypothetical protein
MKMYWGVEICLHAFLTPALDGGEWSASRPFRFSPGKESSVPIGRRPCGPQSRSGRGGEEKNSICSTVSIYVLKYIFEMQKDRSRFREKCIFVPDLWKNSLHGIRK